MRFDIVTIFAEFFAGPLDYGIVRRARESGLIDVRVKDLRAFTHDRHRTVDDRPFGGGEGMVLKPEPLFEAVESLLGEAAPPAATEPASAAPSPAAVILLSASGKLFRQSAARRLASLDRIVLLCGRYEGVDERVAAHLATDEISIGDYVLSGGELGAALIIDAVTRLLPGASRQRSLRTARIVFRPRRPRATRNPGARLSRNLSGAAKRRICFRRHATHSARIPHYTRPAEFRGWTVPEVLLGGNHEEIRRWRYRMALEKTRRNRPDLLAGHSSSQI